MTTPNAAKQASDGYSPFSFIGNRLIIFPIKYWIRKTLPKTKTFTPVITRPDKSRLKKRVKCATTSIAAFANKPKTIHGQIDAGMISNVIIIWQPMKMIVERPKNFVSEKPNRSSQLATIPVANEPTDNAIANRRR